MNSEVKRLLCLAGDGVGPEVMRQARRVMEWYQQHRGIRFELMEGLAGGAAIDGLGVPLPPEVLESAHAVDAIIFGAVGGPKWDGLDFVNRPEQAILRLRKDLDLFANLRPATVYDATIDASTLKPEVIRNLDILIIRELAGGIYFGTPRGVADLPNGDRRATNTLSYSSEEIRRIARTAFELARMRSRRVCSVDKSNVLENSVLWRDVVQQLRDQEFPDISLTHMLADNCAMQLVRAPLQFDVIVTDNMFGDILSDEASMLTGSIGMLPSASLGSMDTVGCRKALYEPIHGSAPDIAGQNIVNPIAMILSVAMAFRYTFGAPREAAALEAAIKSVLKSGLRTRDILQPGTTEVSTTVFTDAVLAHLGNRDAFPPEKTPAHT